MAGAAFVAAVAGQAVLRLGGLESSKANPISAVSVAVVIGLVVRNSIGVRKRFRPGLAFAVKFILRLGIVLVGLKLSLSEVASLGMWGVPFVAVVIVTALVVTSLLARLLRVSSRLGVLTAAATSICGVTAAVATAPAIGASDEELAYTVANVTLFGLLAMLLYPFIAHAVFAGASSSAGMFLGTAIHDTSQVVGAALSYRDLYGDETAFKVATVTKLTRNLFIAVIVPFIGWSYARKNDGVSKSETGGLIPLFVVAFVAMALVRTAGDAIVGDAETWRKTVKLLGDTVSYWCLGTAMAAVGLSTDIRQLRRLGVRPLVLGGAASIVVGLTGLALAAVVGPLVTS